MTAQQSWQAQSWYTPARSSDSSPNMAEGASDENERPLKDLLSDLTHSGQVLLRNEIELAKAELKEQAAQAGKGAALLSGGAVAGLLTLFLLSFAAAWGLAEVMPVWAGFLIVGVVYALIAGGLLMAGKKRLAAVKPAPAQTMATLKRDVETAKTSISRGLHA
jgi:hypothetical protein